jgi:hypothetical protein
MTDREPSREKNAPEEPTPGSLFSQHWEETPEIEEVESYQSLSVVALLSLITGIGALLIFFFTVIGMLLAIAAVAFGFTALVRFGRQGSMLTGKWMAISGIALAFLSVSGEVTRRSVYQQLLVQEAKQFMNVWIDCAREDKPHLLEQLQYPYWQRLVVANEEALWKELLSREDLFQRIEGITRDPVIRTLLELGEKAQYDFYQVDQVVLQPKNDFVQMTYAVTYPNATGEKETFFLRATAKRWYWEEKHAGGWSIQRIEGPVLPEAFGGPLESER